MRHLDHAMQLFVFRKVKVRRHDAHDKEGNSIELDGAADDFGIA